MTYNPNNPNGQATGANSAPVVIASDQTGIPILNSQTALSPAGWTVATSVNTALSISTAGYSSVIVTLSSTTTMTAGVLTFEASADGTTWFPIALTRVDSFTIDLTFALNAPPAARAWTASVQGFTNFRVRLSTSITGTGTATVKIAAQSAAIEPMVTVGQATASLLQTTATLAAGANLVGKVNIATQTTGGATSFTLISAATTNATIAKASAGLLYMLTATNNGASVAYLKLYNKATAPTVGTDTPVMTFMLPAGGGITVPIPPTGITFATGISYAITGGPTLADTTGVALSQVQVNGAYA